MHFSFYSELIISHIIRKWDYEYFKSNDTKIYSTANLWYYCVLAGNNNLPFYI